MVILWVMYLQQLLHVALSILIVMLLGGSSLTISEVDETTITTQSLVTPFTSVHESVPKFTTAYKYAPASKFNQDSLANMAIELESPAKMAATPESLSVTGAMPECMSQMELGLR